MVIIPPCSCNYVTVVIIIEIAYAKELAEIAP